MIIRIAERNQQKRSVLEQKGGQKTAAQQAADEARQTEKRRAQERRARLVKPICAAVNDMVFGEIHFVFWFISPCCSKHSTQVLLAGIYKTDWNLKVRCPASPSISCKKMK